MRDRLTVRWWRVLSLALTMLALGAYGCVDPYNIFVDASAPCGGNGSALLPFQRIADGIEAVAGGGTVHVAAGDYPENLVIDRALRIEGAAGNTARLLADGSRHGIEVVSGDVEIVGMSVAGQGPPDPDAGLLGGIWVEGVDDVALRDNRIGPYASIGIGAGHGANFVIEDNTVEQITGEPLSDQEGIAVGFGGNILVRGNTVRDVPGGGGLLVASSTGLVENNLSTGNLWGILISGEGEGPGGLSVRGNTASGNADVGLALREAVIASFFDNTIVENLGTGLMMMDYLAYLACKIAGGPGCEDYLVTEVLDCGGNTIGDNDPDFYGLFGGIEDCFTGGE